MAHCTFCGGVFIVDACVLQTFRTYLMDNPILCNGCNLKVTHECMYVWNTGSVISKHLMNHINHPEVFHEYYEVFQRQGHVSISKNTFFKKCITLMKDREFVAQLIPTIIEQQFATADQSVSGCSNQYIIDMQGFKISSHEFIIREFCLMACDASMLFHCMVNLPCEITELPLGYQKQVEWLTQNFHGLKWDSSNGYSVAHLRKMMHVLCEPDAIFYCKGTEKVDWIKKIFQLNIVKDVTDQGCTALNALNFNVSVKACTYHNPIEMCGCALRNVVQLQYWLKLQHSNVVEAISTISL